jgi:hypothetical protein
MASFDREEGRERERERERLASLPLFIKVLIP